MVFNLTDLSTTDIQYYLSHVVAPRPICLASTVDGEGRVNLSPFSFFNIFSSNPPIVIFSPARRVRDNTTKHTLENVREIPEVVINIVSFDMVQQVSLSSADYPRQTDEFIKAGFTKQRATVVRPPMVKESKVKLECRVTEVKSLGGDGGAGQLVICEVLVLHLDNRLLDVQKKIDPARLDLVARLGADWYCRVSRKNLFTLPKPPAKPGIGIDQLPYPIRTSPVLSGNHLALLANVEAIPAVDPPLQRIAFSYSSRPAGSGGEADPDFLHHAARKLIDTGQIDWAWQVLLMEDPQKK